MKKQKINEKEFRIESREERRKNTREIKKALSKGDSDTVKEPATMKTAVIRVSRINQIKEDNDGYS